MSIWGVGPSIGRPTFFYLLVAVAATLAWPRVSSFGVPRRYLITAGCALLVLALPLYAVTVRAVKRAHREDRLITNGPYAVCRHPLYALWILLVLPAGALLLDSWPVLTSSVVMYAITRVKVRREEEYLEERFGDAYREYQRRVGAVFPTLRRR